MSTQRLADFKTWFRIREVEDGIFHIWEPGYRADYRCNVYLVKGSERDVIFDTGLGLASLKDFLAPLSPDPLLVCSHSHYDHMGSNWQFRERLIHAAEAEIVAHPTRENTYADPVLVTQDFLQLPWPNFAARDWQPQAAPATGTIGEGDIIDLGDRAFTILSTPGHSWGSVCLWEEKSGTMFCADTIYQGELFDFLPCSDIPTYLGTMRRLREYSPRVAFPGHGPILDGAAYRRVIDDYLAARDEAPGGKTR